MKRWKVLIWSLVLAVIAAVAGTLLWPQIERQYFAWKLGHTFYEWNGFGDRITSADTVEVLVLDRQAKEGDVVGISGYADYHVSSKVVLTGDAAYPYRWMWHNLIYSPAASALCHAPPYGLRFIENGKTIGEATICWKCANIHLRGSGGEGLYGFNADRAIWLLEDLKKIAPFPEKPKG